MNAYIKFLGESLEGAIVFDMFTLFQHLFLFSIRSFRKKSVGSVGNYAKKAYAVDE